jgi:hypothetical protein
MLPGEHFVKHISSWTEFELVVDLIAAGSHQFETIVIDTIDDVYKFCDAHVADSRGVVAAGMVDFGKGTAEAESRFRRVVGKLLAAPYGVWFVGHAELAEVNKVQKWVPALDKRVRNYVAGVCGFLFIAERSGVKRQLQTQPSERFEAGSRVPLPEPMEMDAKKLYAAMAAGLKPTKTETKEVAA